MKRIIGAVLLTASLAACGGSKAAQVAAPTANRPTTTIDPTTAVLVTTTTAPASTTTTTVAPECVTGSQENRNVTDTHYDMWSCVAGKWQMTGSKTITVPVVFTDFTIDLIVTDSQCFNSAGGLVTVEPDLHFNGSAEAKDAIGAATLVYEIQGAQTTETHSLELLADHTYTYDSQTVETTTCDAILTAVPVRFIER